MSDGQKEQQKEKTSHISPSEIAAVAISHYERLPNKGKPQQNEWTVYAAIVATCTEENKKCIPWVVSCATGSKCTAITDKKEACASMILHDSHAEVLARRGLMRVLWEEISFHRDQDQKDSSTSISTSLPSSQKNTKHCLLNTIDKGVLQLRCGVQLHLYVSDSPCGDSSIYELAPTGHDQKTDSSNNENLRLNFTGAKVIISQKSGVTLEDCGGSNQLLPVGPGYLTEDGTPTQGNDNSLLQGDSKAAVAREEVQILGALRTKSGRSNLPQRLRSISLSCSDKLVRWQVLGLQGVCISRFIPEPICFASICVSGDPQAKSQHCQLLALQRAVPCRVRSVLHALTEDAIDRNTQSLEEASCVLTNVETLKRVACPVHICEQPFERGKAFVQAARASLGVAAPTNSDLTSLIDNINDESCQKRKLEVIERESKRQRCSIGKRCSPCGFSINWQQPVCSTAEYRISFRMEVTVGARGIKQGKKPKNLQDYQSHASRLSRWAFVQMMLRFEKDISFFEDADSYQCQKSKFAKKSSKAFKEIVLGGIFGPLKGWYDFKK